MSSLYNLILIERMVNICRLKQIGVFGTCILFTGVCYFYLILLACDKFSFSELNSMHMFTAFFCDICSLYVDD